MVLSNASSPTNNQDLSNEGFSDPDPYDDSGLSTPKSQYVIDMKNLPKPVPIIGSLLGYHRRFKQEAHLKILLASKELERPLNQDEVDAIAYWLAKRQAITSWGAPIGFAGGCWRAYDTAKTYKFPFWQPNSSYLKVNVFGPLRGPPAIICWHTLRVLAYGLTGDFIGRLLLGSYAMSTAAVGASNDPRLYDYMTSIKEKVRDISGKETKISNTTGYIGKQIRRSPEDITDDASPTNKEGVFYDEVYSESDQASDKTAYSKVNEKRWTIPKSALPPQNTDTNPIDDFYKNQSPQRSEIPNDVSSENSHVSTWERIRSGQNIPQSSSHTKPNRPLRSRIIKKNDSNDESFSYSKSDEERFYAKDEAQNDFDTKIDRERHGGGSV